MSYILDALKKSEQERGHGDIPDVQTVHSSSLNYRNEKKAYWPYVLIIAVLLNLIAIVYFIANKEKPAETGNLEQTVNAVTHTTVESDVIADKKTQQAEKKKAAVTNTDKQTAGNETKIIDFYDLPESIKKALPSITISAHVYSTEPMQRSIVINNNFLEEGEYVLDGLVLYEITPNGAIFNYQGTLFSYDVVSGWQQ